MGHQSYVLPLNTEEEKKRILEVIRQHNQFEYPEDADKDYDAPVGEELTQICYVRLLKKKRPKYLMLYTHAILCGNGGGRIHTFDWFYDHDVNAFPFDSSMRKFISAESTWETIDFDGKVYKLSKKTKQLEVIDDYKWKNEEEDNYDLSRDDAEEWILKQCEEYAWGEMTQWKIKKLESIPGWKWMTYEELSEARKKQNSK